MTPIQALVKNPKWGKPQGYDITITRKGSTINDTEYAVMPNPHTPVASEITEALSKTKIDLTLLYVGGDPFNPEK